MLAEHSGYHHGETSLFGGIIGMAQDLLVQIILMHYYH